MRACTHTHRQNKTETNDLEVKHFLPSCYKHAYKTTIKLQTPPVSPSYPGVPIYKLAPLPGSRLLMQISRAYSHAHFRIYARASSSS